MSLNRSQSRSRKEQRSRLSHSMQSIPFFLLIFSFLLLLSGCAQQQDTGRFDLQPLQPKTERVFTLTVKPIPSFSYADRAYEGFVGYNGLVPGPVLHAYVGERLTVHLRNAWDENVTIHWHGLQVPNDMDGVPFVTQDPVPPGGSFTYSFTLTKPGVYWYHSHVKTDEQIERGLQGVLIVDDPFFNLPVSRDRVIVLDDVRLTTRSIAPFRLLMDGHMAGRYGNAYLINGKPQEEFTVPRHGLVRLRLVNTANARIFTLRVSQPFLRLGEGIGLRQTPILSQELILAPGERADVLFLMNESPITLTHTNTRIPTELIRILPAETYANDSSREAWERLVNVSVTYLENLPNWTFMRAWEPNITLVLQGARDARSPYGFSWQINGGAWPYAPDLQNLTEGSLYKIRYVNTQRVWHPMHVHGQKFIVLSVNGKPQEIDAWRDMVLVPPGGSVDIALRAENTGDWVEHYHILEHAELGMLGIFRVSNETVTVL